MFKYEIGLYPFTLPFRDKDENQEIESIEASLREGNALSLTNGKYSERSGRLAVQDLHDGVQMAIPAGILDGCRTV